MQITPEISTPNRFNKRIFCFVTILILVILTQSSAWSASIVHRVLAPKKVRTYFPNYPDGSVVTVWAGKRYVIAIGIRKDMLNCTVRVGLKVNNSRLVKLKTSSVPVRFNRVDFTQTFGNFVETVKFPESSCYAAAEFTVKKPPQPNVPVVLTLSYGPFLKKQVHLMVRQTIKIKSISASPRKSHYSNGSRVRFQVQMNQPGPYDLEFGISEGLLCNSHGPDRYLNKRKFGPTRSWTKLPVPAKKTKTWIEGNLCKTGKTTLHVRLKFKPKGSMKTFSVNVAKKGHPKKRRR